MNFELVCSLPVSSAQNVSGATLVIQDFNNELSQLEDNTIDKEDNLSILTLVEQERALK